MTSEPAIVFVVDDDPAIRKALARLLPQQDSRPAAFLSPQAFLDEHDPATPGCVVLDIAMPGLNGLELQQALAVSGRECSIIFITGQGDIPMSVRAMKAGAVDFLTKPIEDEQLLAAVRTALARDRMARRNRAEVDDIVQRLATLTQRELEVLEHVVTGQINKQIAADLGTVEKTIKVHRGRVMAKMGVNSLAELVRVAERAGITSAGSQSRVDRPLAHTI